MDIDLVPFRRLVPAVLLALGACGLWPTLAAATPLGAAPSSLSFAQELVGKTSSSQGVSVSNPLPGRGQVEGVSIGGADPDDFEITAESCAGAALEPFEGCEVEVAFAPQAGGARSAVLEIGLEGEATLVVPLAIALTGVSLFFAARSFIADAGKTASVGQRIAGLATAS